MENNQSLGILQKNLSKENLTKLIDTAQTVNEFLPPPIHGVLHTIITRMNLLMGLVPQEGSAMERAAKVADTISRANNVEKEAFDRMFKIASSDGVISDEEYNLLLEQAKRAGISEGELKLMICNI